MRSGQRIAEQGTHKPLYLDHPQFEGFEVLQTMGRPKTAAA